MVHIAVYLFLYIKALFPGGAIGMGKRNGVIHPEAVHLALIISPFHHTLIVYIHIAGVLCLRKIDEKEGRDKQPKT